MVVPERDRPGKTANACAIPIIRACKGLISSFWRGLAKYENVNRQDVTSNMMPTMVSPDPKMRSTSSLKNTPTMPTGIMDIRMLMA